MWQVKKYRRQLLKGLAYVHGMGIILRDLKTANLLEDRSGTLKMADFGMARTKDETPTGRLTNPVIRLWYR